MPTIFYIIFYPFFYSSCYRWVLMVTSKRYVLSTSRCHILGSPEQKTVTYQCVERPSSSELNLYSSCPLLYFTTGGIVALLRSSGISLKCFCKVGRVPFLCRLLWICSVELLSSNKCVFLSDTAVCDFVKYVNCQIPK